MKSLRFENEILHGKKLSLNKPEKIWGWSSPAGKARAWRRAQMIVNGARVMKGIHILEVGCGTGLFTELFLQSGAYITAIDISNDLISLAMQRRLPLDHVEFMTMGFEDYKNDVPIDAIVGSSILHHLDIASALEKMYVIVRPGGYLGFAEPNMLNPQIVIQKNIPLIKKWSGDSPNETAFIKWRLKSLLSKIGFEEIQITPFDWLHPITPKSMIGVISQIGKLIENIPVIREFAGSLLITCRRPLKSC